MSAQSAGEKTAKASQDFGKVPIYFEENRGQTDDRARFIARTGSHAAFLTQDGWTLSLHGAAVSMRVAGANRKAVFAAEGTVEGISNYFLGSRAITGLPHYASVRITDIRPGIDILYHASARDLEYDFVIRRGANPNALRLRFDGGKRPVLDSNGDLLFKTSAGELRQRRPRVWQVVQGQRKEIECRYALSGPSEVKLVLEDYNRSTELVVDPVLAYSTYLGEAVANDGATGIAADSQGYAYVTGFTQSMDFPVTTGTYHGNEDAFVTKFNTSGSGLIYSTFIGGSAWDRTTAIAIDNAGNAYVTGFTASNDFPFTINHYAGTYDAFVAKLDPLGNIVYCTALGGSSDDVANAIAVDASGSAYVTGYTYSNDFPATVGSFKTTLTVYSDVFVAKLAPTGQISYATYIGAGSIGGAAIAVDSSGNAFVAGTAWSFPVTQGAYSTAFGGGTDGFIMKLNPTGSALLFGTYLGGSSYDYISGLAIDAAGNSYVVGTTTSTDFPTTPGAFATTKPGFNSGFATKLNATGSALVYSTFLGENAYDLGTAIAVDLNGIAFVGGNTQSINFPTTPGSLQTVLTSGFADMFVVKLSADGSALSYSTLLGGANQEFFSALALDGNGGVYMAGWTAGQTYPTTSGAFQVSNPKTIPQCCLYTAVVSKIDFSSPTLCNPSVSPQSQSLPGAGGSISFNLTLSPGCPWEAVSDSFITVSAPAHGVISTSPVTINGTVPLNDAISGGRTGTVRIGTATFTVNQDAKPASLSIGKTHSGIFLPGQQNATYAVTVSNAATAGPTSGTVMVTETVPSGLNLVSMAGTGWNCPGTAANNCTRSDALNPGSSYPTITVTVSVTANGTSPQVNAVNVSGGGSAAANASDTTNIGVPATLTVPSNGSTLAGSLVNFQWTPGIGVSQYWISISKLGAGGGDLFNADPGPGLVTSRTITGLPTDGSTIYVRLYSHIGGSWPSLDYTCTASGPANMINPANGSTLSGTSVNFQWTAGTGVTQYWLSISKVGVGGGDLYNADPGPGLVTSKIINGLPADGSTIYVRLYSHIGTGWPSLDYTYTATGPAAITYPANGSTLPGASVTFQWTTGTGVTQYWLSIFGAGGYLYNSDPGPGLVTSKTISGLPVDGSAVYVRLYSHIGNSWPWLEYVYTAAGPATMITPMDGSTLPGSSVQFHWTTGSGVSQYWLSISKIGIGGGDLYNADPGPGLFTAKTISGLPTDGSTIYVRLYSHTGTTWPSRDYTYTAFH